MMLLVIKDLTKTYSRQQKTFEAVSHAAFSLKKGEMAVITGPSGCGKSTLFHLICGITRPDQGSIQLEKRSWWDSLIKSWRKCVRKRSAISCRETACCQTLPSWRIYACRISLAAVRRI